MLYIIFLSVVVFLISKLESIEKKIVVHVKHVYSEQWKKLGSPKKLKRLLNKKTDFYQFVRSAECANDSELNKLVDSFNRYNTIVLVTAWTFVGAWAVYTFTR